nr:hypothetical protein BaRGS_030619 [Batillaria attramentaria]
MSCLETVYNDCASESKHQKNPLDVMVDPGRWRNVIQSFCDNVDCKIRIRVESARDMTRLGVMTNPNPALFDLIADLALHEDCQQKIVVESSSCIQERSAGFQNRTSEVLASALKDKNRNREKMLEDMLAVGCRFAEEVLDCLMKPLKGECPCRYQRIIQETVVGVMPPFCHMEASDDEDDFDCDYDDETSSDDGFSVDSDTSNNGDDVNNNNYNNYNDIYSSNGGHVVIDKDEDRETRYEDTYPKYRGPPRGLGVEGKYNVHDGSSQDEFVMAPAKARVANAFEKAKLGV